MYEYDVLYLLQHGWTLHVTYGSTRHNLSAGVVVTPPTARQKAAVVPVHALQSGESWRATWSAESVAKEFASFARVEDVACKLGITREAVYKHLKRLAKTYIVERRKFGYVEFRVTTRPVPNYDPTPRLPAIKSDARRTTYAELQDRLKRDRQASMAV
jgi:DNA-binding transcriptional ArsR family regulator